MEDRLNELIAFSNKLDAFFAAILADAAALYPGSRQPRRRNKAVLVHASLSAFGGGLVPGVGPVPGAGLVPGGAETVIASLTRVCGKTGMTVVMPAHSDCAPDRSVVFDRRLTPCRLMGAVAEAFRSRYGVRRSAHPYLSFCAFGPASKKMVRGHRFETGLGPDSPLGTLHRMDALVLMLGTGYETCTAMHLAEYAAAGKLRAQGKQVETVTCHAGTVHPFGSGISWKCVEDIAFHPERFPETGRAFETAFPEKLRTGTLGNGTWRLLRLRDLVGFSIDRCGVLE